MNDTLDRARLDAFVDDVGDLTFAAETVQTYLSTLDRRVAALTAALGSGDHHHVVVEAHTLKSTSALLGATALADLCGDLERASAPAAGDGTVLRLTEIAGDTRRELAGWLTERSPGR
ncbi:Hpt domain-containing protein [Nakamurella sp.]|uniref:Hpt domain-containing protein n=1 Tax=Nakamurella sp. TaxID=1869182 RepID=UPI003B3B140F